MRTRLQGIVLFLVGLAVFGLGIPLARSVAQSEQQRLFVDRLTDTSRFASVAQRPLTEDRAAPLRDQLRRYTEVYGIEVAVFNRETGLVVDSGTHAISPDDPAVKQLVGAALAGRQPSPGPLLLPWDDRKLMLAEPVLVDGEVRGAVLTVSPTDRTRQRVLLWWLGIAIGGVVVFLLALFAALPVVRWIMRPVGRLDEATGALVGAVVSGRPVEPVGDDQGPAELRRLSRSFDRMASRVNEALRAQRKFVADASHQLRNPLTVLKLRLANLEGHVDSSAEEHRAAALAEADRLKQTLDDLLSMARAEGAGDPVPTEVAPSVADRAADWRVLAANEDVRLEVDPIEAGTMVLLPPRGMETILDALLDNALKFSPPDTEVRIGVGGDDDELTLTVRDHGPGLDPDELERATDRFWRSPAHQNVTGSGLGLAIVRSVVDRVGGSMELSLPDGGGLAVTVRVPRVQTLASR
ncbi:sensor histidine kinase [Labedaea rhizosphaerae]|uniref:histidine kinase n=1 Tax=Labedaea rhizosphaerae TaxID=598644 RepID=A0A4R6RR20_LABRH|nr:HAMP domain-containing sensor histidine kinase [Labedaea rhizosphaerae]TDP89190.1 signal transduction histidine kinase [Labedaea rhizosphaerae]